MTCNQQHTPPQIWCNKPPPPPMGWLLCMPFAYSKALETTKAHCWVLDNSYCNVRLTVSHSFATIPCINRSFLYQLILWEWVHPVCENWMKFPGSYWEFTCLTIDRCPISTSHWGVGSSLRGVNEMWQQHHAVLVNSSVCIEPNVWFLLLRVSCQLQQWATEGQRT